MNKLLLMLITVPVIWAAVLVAVSTTLKGTPQYTEVLVLVAGGAAATVILIGAIYRRITHS